MVWLTRAIERGVRMSCDHGFMTRLSCNEAFMGKMNTLRWKSLLRS